MSRRKPLYPLHENDIQASESGHRWLDLVRDHVLDIRTEYIAIDPPSLLSLSTGIVTVTVPGIKFGDEVLKVCKPSLSSGIFVAHGVVTADSTIDVLFINSSPGVVNDPEEVYAITYIKYTR